jgi:hypothetical protein
MLYWSPVVLVERGMAGVVETSDMRGPKGKNISVSQ